MSYRDSGPRPRRVRRQSTPSARSRTSETQVDLPGPLRVLTNPKVFVTLGIVFAAAIVVSLFAGIVVTGPSSDDGPIRQANELADAPRSTAEAEASASPTPAPQSNVKRYAAPPQMVIDATKRYLATISTPKGEIQMELYPDQAPEAVNAFVFLAREGYYTGTPFMELVKDQTGSRFYTQTGDPTRTGLGTPGFSVKKEQTSRPFGRGAVGMGGSSATSNGGQFFISFGDYPALNGKYTIFGQVVGGLDVLDRLSLLDLTRGSGSAGSGGDVIQSVTITES